MVIVKLMGGLGNQLFQYSTGKALALKHNTSLKLDLSFLNTNSNGQHTQRKLELDNFQVNYQIAEAVDLKPYFPVGAWKKALRKYLPFFSKKATIVNERQFSFDSTFFSNPLNTYLNGFWQTEKYFKNIRNELLSEMVLKDEISEQTKKMSELIKNTNSISIHFRRGDYVTNKNANSFHGVLPLDYYKQAIEYFEKKMDDFVFFVFSDDIDWVKANFVINNRVEYIDFNSQDKSVFDLYLMSLCKNNIIANSSFSWWGAWLNKNENKTVIAPNQWFLNEEINTSDLIPEKWIKL